MINLQPTYHIKVKDKGNFLGIFNKDVMNDYQINGLTGEIIILNKSWYWGEGKFYQTWKLSK